MASWILLLLAMLFLTPRFDARAGSDVQADKLDLIPEDASLWNESLLWDREVALRAGIGYKDNVLLTSASAHGSPFYTSGLDLAIYRLPLDGLEFNLSVTGDDIRYWHDVGLHGEDAFLSSAHVQKYLGCGWKAGLELKAAYFDEMVQALVSTGGVRTVAAKGYSLALRPFVRHDFASNWWLQLETPATREWYEGALDDDWKAGAQMILGRSFGNQAQVSLSYGAFYIPHDDWLARDGSGNELTNKLSLWRQDVEMKWEQHWDEHRRWRSIAKLEFHYDRDNGGGFFDYYRYQVSEELRFHSKYWEVKGHANLSYFDFPVQAVDNSTNSPTLHLTALNLTLRVERLLYGNLKLYGEYSFEKAVSNSSYDRYAATTVTGGVSWGF
jgi:hypothetical protein